MLDLTPDPVALQLGPLTIGWYGLMYVLGLFAAYQVLVRLARMAGEDPELVGNGMVVVAIAAVIGGRLYHVIDQWSLYQDDLLKIVLPPYSGLGVYGGIATGLVALLVYVRMKQLSLARWADIIAPALFVMQAIGRWGNFFNQELYGPPTNLPWAIPIDCEHRIPAYPCETFAFETTGFHPLFLYESLSGLLGAAVLIWLGYRARRWLRPGDLGLLFFIWYGVVRFAVETLRQDNWTFFGIPTAQIVSAAFVLAALALLIWRHRTASAADDPAPTFRGSTWGAASGWSEDWEDDDADDEDLEDAEDAEQPDAEQPDAEQPDADREGHDTTDPPST